MSSGIYAIRNVINNRRYIGSTGKLSKRWSQHKYDLNCKSHCNNYLQKAWNKYTEKSFVYEILEECSLDILLEREEYWIKQLHSHKNENGYNICIIPRASRLGCKSSKETIKKLKKSLGGKNHPMWGKHLKKSTKKKLRDLQLGIPKPNSGVKKKYEIINPKREKIEIIGLRNFCRENNLNPSMLLRVIQGKQKEHKGWSSDTYIPKEKTKKVGYWRGKKLSEKTKQKMSISAKEKHLGPISEKHRQAIIDGIKRKNLGLSYNGSIKVSQTLDSGSIPDNSTTFLNIY